MYYCCCSSGGLLETAMTILLHSRTNFLSDIPYFTVIGKTQGGPPTDYKWTKDRIPFTDSAIFNITIAAIPQNTEFRYQDSIYESTLTVIGTQPGIYQYTATNDVSPNLTAEIVIEGIKNSLETSI